jgi:hypothetical protein
MEKPNNSPFPTEKLMKIGIPLFIVFIVLITIYLIYYYLNRNTWKMGSNILELDLINTSTPKVIPNCEIVNPIDYANYSIDFKIFIENFNENHTYWRHVFHKGTYANLVETINYKFKDPSEKNNGWKELVEKFKEQSLGVWLHPNKNTLRICLTTRTDLNEKERYDTNEHPYGEFKTNTKYRSNERLVDTMDQIEYCDLENIPIKNLTQITITLDKNVLSLYVNKVLRKVCTFEGVPLYNSRPLFFVHQRSFDGHIKDFRMIPYFIKDTQIAKL